MLIIDDSQPILDLTATMLKLFGYHSLQASSGIEGLKIAALEVPELILLDAVMPEMDGFKICRQLKRNPPTATIPIFMMSATQTTADVESARAAGADEFVTKPFNSAELAELIETYIGAGE